MELQDSSLRSDANLKAYYRMEGNSNASVGGVNGSDTAMSYNSAYGKFGQGALFVRASSSRISLGNPSLLQITGAFTINCWIKASTFQTGGGICTIMAHWSYPVGYRFGYSNARLICQGFLNSDLGSALDPNDSSTGVWYMVTYVYNPSVGQYIYRNGVQVGSMSAPASMGNPAVNTVIGDSSTSGELWDGDIDDLSIFNRVLSPTEIADLYQRNLTKALTDTATSSDSISKGSSRILTDTATSSDSISKGSSRILSDISTMSDSIVRAISKFLSDSLSGIIDDLDIFQSRGLEFNDTITTTDELTRQWNTKRELNDVVNASDSVTKEKRTFFIFSDSVILSDLISKTQVAIRSFYDSITTSDSIRKVLNGFIVTKWLRSARATVVSFIKTAKATSLWTKTERPDDL